MPIRKFLQLTHKCFVALFLITFLSAHSPVEPDRNIAVGRILDSAEWLLKMPAENDPQIWRAMSANQAPLTVLHSIAEGNEEAFSAHLQSIGYGEVGFSEWLSEASVVFGAFDAAQYSSDRSLSEIQADLISLPTVPLNEADRARLDATLKERAFATLDADFRDEINNYLAQYNSIVAQLTERNRQ